MCIPWTLDIQLLMIPSLPKLEKLGKKEDIKKKTHGRPQKGKTVKISWVNLERGRREAIRDGTLMIKTSNLGERHKGRVLKEISLWREPLWG